MLILYGTLGILLIVLGIIVLKNKDSIFLYDITEKLKKKKSIIDKEKLSRFSGIGCIFVGIEIIMLYISFAIDNYMLFLSMRMVIAITLMYLVCSSQRYDATNFNEKGKIKFKTKLAMFFMCLIILFFTFGI